MYSDMSTRIRACSVPKTASASALESSVFPTPVGPRNRKDPVGRFGSFNPTLPRFTAFATAVTASSWPTTRLWSVCSSLARRFDSPSARRCTGIFVQVDTVFAISSSVTCSFLFLQRRSKRFRICSRSFSSSCWRACSSFACSKSPALIADSFSFCTSNSVCSSFAMLSGTW